MRYKVFSMGTREQGDHRACIINSLMFQFDSSLNIYKGDWFRGDTFDLIHNTSETKSDDARSIIISGEPGQLESCFYWVQVRELFKNCICLTVKHREDNPYYLEPEFFYEPC